MMIHHCEAMHLANGRKPKLAKSWQQTGHGGGGGQPIRNLARGHNPPAPPNLCQANNGQNHGLTWAKFQPTICLASSHWAKTDHRAHGKLKQWLNLSSPSQTWHQPSFVSFASKKFPIRLKSITGKVCKAKPFTTPLPSWSMFMNFSKYALPFGCFVPRKFGLRHIGIYYWWIVCKKITPKFIF
ncbi:hypothetical protein GmHk_U060122 [Glycine max]|nr:hypothetical protein GmHk_U060122 [Glycine max]